MSAQPSGLVLNKEVLGRLVLMSCSSHPPAGPQPEALAERHRELYQKQLVQTGGAAGPASGREVARESVCWEESMCPIRRARRVFAGRENMVSKERERA